MKVTHSLSQISMEIVFIGVYANRTTQWFGGQSIVHTQCVPPPLPPNSIVNLNVPSPMSQYFANLEHGDLVTSIAAIFKHLKPSPGLELRIQRGKAIFKKGTLRKGQEVLTFGGASKAIQKGTNNNNFFPMGHIHRITTGHQGHKKKGHLFLEGHQRPWP